MLDFLLDKSYNDYRHVLLLLKSESIDPEFTDWFSSVLYNLQQAFEKALKSYIRQKGGVTKRIHDVEQLYYDAKELELNYTPCHFIMLDQLTNWEAATRYDVKVTPNEVNVKTFLDDFTVLYNEVLALEDKNTLELRISKILESIGKSYISVNAIMNYIPTVSLSEEVLSSSIKEVVKLLEGD